MMHGFVGMVVDACWMFTIVSLYTFGMWAQLGEEVGDDLSDAHHFMLSGMR